MNIIKSTFVLLMLVIVSSCNSNDDTPINNQFPQKIIPVLIAHNVIFSDFPNIPPERINLIIDNEAEWQNFNIKMGTQTYNFSEMTIDFEDFQVIALFDFPTGGTGIENVEATSVFEHEQNINVDILYIESEENSCFGYTGNPSRKYYIFKIPKSPKPILFTSSSVIPACPEGNFAVGIKKETPIEEVFATLGNLDLEINQVHEFWYYLNDAGPDQVEELIDLFNQKTYINISAYDRAKPANVYYQPENNRIRIILKLFDMTPANQADFVTLISTLGLEDAHNHNRTLYIEVPEGSQDSWITQMTTYPFVVWASEM